ncbi:hypothetical protein SAMN02745146_3577 [Hymenobacter daecheongensis DSM 21074]|uniref:Uncharacterized protein n=2 Tax=Hymenobacter daecheongensis TaxID=496053 RepID=A0A1M6KVG3_9BACT|nr:hypothetical protein SAMN02745146_3577 [Hymenobacter daecheongensis DSM 21074]
MGQQADYLACHGDFLAERTEDSFSLRLFAWGDFYAEVWRIQDEEQILFIHLFQQPAGLVAYLDSIRLPEVF